MVYWAERRDPMKILIDADGCPVVDIAVRLCREFEIPCLLLCDTAHTFFKDGAQTLIFDKGPDSVDYALVNRVMAGDIVVTQDYGLASICLARKAIVLHQDGWQYTPENIDGLLLLRHTSRIYRNSGVRMHGPKKRTASQNTSFETSLHRILQTVSQGYSFGGS